MLLPVRQPLPEVIGVLDLLGGQVVRGIAGRRSEYRPIASRLCASSAPADVASGFIREFGLARLYLADLDAIAGGEPAWDVYGRVLEQGVELIVDAGVSGAARAEALGRFVHRDRPLHGVVLGLETLAGPAELAAAARVLSAEQEIFSLDLKEGVPLAQSGWSGAVAVSIVATAAKLGIRRFILLDLARVGTGGGPGTEDLCALVRRRWPNSEVIAGGGVRCVDDLVRLGRAGATAALVASALHDGQITREQIAGES